MVLVVLDREAAQDGVSVLTALIGDVLLEHSVHPSQLPKVSRLVGTACSFNAPIHFLKSDKIGLRLADHGGDPFEVDLPVHTLAVMDVVRQHPDSNRVLRNAAGQSKDGEDRPGDKLAEIAAHRMLLNIRFASCRSNASGSNPPPSHSM